MLTILRHVPEGIGTIAGMISIGMTVYDYIKGNLSEKKAVISSAFGFDGIEEDVYKKFGGSYPED